MPTLTVDGVEITVEQGTTVLQACELAGKEIPRFCYHERLSIAGNCRMCLVELERAPKPIASCAMAAGDGMAIKTDTPMVKKAREGVMEFLLINHPLDCPICDQGGECDLQDQAMAYGGGLSRYVENKRAVADKDMGPLVKTIMTRCIHCTRCIRFAEEIGGVETIGVVNRGEHMEIATLEQAINSELSGNVIDLCPVGALTSKPFAFTARSWELTNTETIDAMDAVGSNIRVDSRGSEVMRILPRLHDDVNEEWISDKTRFCYDGLRCQRLDSPFVRRDGKLVAASWQEAFAAIAERLDGLDGAKIAAIVGDLVPAEAMFALGDLFDRLGSPNIDCRQDGAAIDPACRAGYLFNTTIAGIEAADALLIVGANPRREAALVNARIRKRWLAGNFEIGVVGPAPDLTYRYRHLGAGPKTLLEIAGGSHDFARTLKQAERPMLIVGMGALTRPDGAAVLAAARAIAEGTGMIAEGWNGFNLLHTAAGRVAGLDLGLVPGTGGRDVNGIVEGAAAGDVEVVYLLGADEVAVDRLGEAFVIYQGSHGDAGAQRADVILPGSAYTEQNGTWVNLEGRVQVARRAIFPPGEAREDWTILRALSDRLGCTLGYDNAAELRRRMVEIAPHLAEIDAPATAAWGPFGTPGAVEPAPFESAVADFYLTNPITRASATMAECSALFATGDGQATGTDG